ncbi:GNAT family N-acetyltransferase [Halobaculum lipolyticum]|uniref:GNAT family N-acetyltransferase n=1 Tax=Halobaculum lipolyticum TaxID=3032001 RepID=A0ABD5WC92_9EURY|nr:GNAT family protein [Halobaculum sp. DT31]
MAGTRVADGDRVTLRTVEREDLEFVQRAATEPAIRHPLGSTVRTRDELAEAFEERDDTFLLVCVDGGEAGPNPEVVDGTGAPGTGETRPIGAVRVESTDRTRPELSYWLAPEVHGQGYGTESVALAVADTFRSRAVPAVAAGVYADNDASRRLVESLGFSEEGRLRRHSFADGAYRDLVTYSLLREEWEENRTDG